MVITYYGISCFKLQSGDTVLAIDPFSKESGLTPPRFEAHAVLSSHAHPNHANIDSLSAKKETSMFTITGPGEYEFRGIFVRGIPSFHDTREGKEKGQNTIYTIEWEGMRMVHLGDFGESELRSETQEAIGAVDILFVPMGGKDTVDAEHAVKMVNKIEPRVVVPMHYKIPGLKTRWESVEEFLKEIGEKIKPEEKLTIKKKDLPSAEETRVVVLKTP